MTIRDLLQRFRPAGTPGPAARAAVPADRAAATAHELAPVFALLADATAEAARIRAEADEGAHDTREAATRRAARLLADAHEQAGAARAEAFAAARAQAESAGSALLAEANTDAQRVRRHAQQMLPEYARRAVTGLLTALAEEQADDPAAAGQEPENAASVVVR